MKFIKSHIKHIIILIIVAYIFYYYFISIKYITSTTVEKPSMYPISIKQLEDQVKCIDSRLTIKDVFNNLTDDIIDDIRNNPSDYRLVDVTFKFENKSKHRAIYQVKLEPHFSKKLEDNLISYQDTLELNGAAAPVHAAPKSYDCSYKEIILKSNGKSDEELLKEIEETKYDVYGKVSNFTNYSRTHLLDTIE